MIPLTYEKYKEYDGKEVSVAGVKFLLEKPVLNGTRPKDFQLQTSTVYSFPKRGDWATHHLNSSYRGNFAPEIARNMILRYSRKGEIVFDPFCGSGTTLIEAKLLDRKPIGMDINKDSVLLSWNRLDFGKSNGAKLYIGDARRMSRIRSDSIDFVLTHPPYANIIRYSRRQGDLSLLDRPSFIREMGQVASEIYRILKPGKFFAMLIGDARAGGKYRPIAYQAMKQVLGAGFSLKEDIIKLQWNCSSTGYWRSQSEKYNFHLIMHEHLFVFRK